MKVKVIHVDNDLIPKCRVVKKIYRDGTVHLIRETLLSDGWTQTGRINVEPEIWKQLIAD